MNIALPMRPRAYENRTDAYRAGQFLRATLLRDDQAMAWCRQHGVAVERAAGETVGSTGGFLAPTEVEAAIIKLRPLASTFRRNARVQRMGSDSRSFPRLNEGLTAAFVGENAQIAEQERQWSSVTLNAKKAAALTRLSSELAEDEVVDFAEDFTADAAYALARLEDDCGWNGDGTSTHGGITGLTTSLVDGTHTAGAVTAGSNHDTFEEIDASDLAALIAACPEYALQSAKWYASAYAIGKCFARLGAAAAGLTMAIDGPRPAMHYLGWPIEPVPSLPGAGDQSGKVMIAFGDLSLSATFGDRRGVTVNVSQNRYLEFDQYGVRATERFDIAVHDLGDNTTAGPMVGLVGA